MNVISKDVAAAGFDTVAWREELLALNPWARGLTIDDNNAEFAAARQKATLARHAEGKEAWNGWANVMLALKAALEAAGQWAVEHENPWRPPGGKNEASRAWLALASAVFSTEVLKHRFETAASFLWLVFPMDAQFQGAAFTGSADFERTTFSGSADFQRATFGGDAEFMDATFGGGANFGRTTFGGRTGFWRTTFSGPAGFSSAAFSDRTSFWHATFSGSSYFVRSQFNAEAEFGQARFNEPVTFADSIFRQGANFDNVDCEAAFSIANATFTQVPGFFGATFKGTLRLDNVATPRYPWLGYTRDQDATARFRELRRRAMEAQDHDRELEFFAQEVRTGRFHAKGLPSWVPKVWSWRFWFGLGFGALSDFGRSLWRPLVSWLALAALCAAFYLGEHDDLRKTRAALAPTGLFSTLAAYAATTRHALADPPPCRIQGREPFASTDAVTEAIQLSLKNALVFNLGGTDSARRTLGCLYGLEQDGDQQHLRVRVSMASTGQALASGLLIFLFALAARNLLRLK